MGGYDDGVEYVFENIRLCVNNTVNNGNILLPVNTMPLQAELSVQTKLRSA